MGQRAIRAGGREKRVCGRTDSPQRQRLGASAGEVSIESDTGMLLFQILWAILVGVGLYGRDDVYAANLRGDLEIL